MNNKQEVPKVKIQNIVSSFMLEPELNLRKIREAFKDECFFETLNDKRYTFRVVALRTKNPRYTFLIYRTGKVVCVGVKTIRLAQESPAYLVRRFQEKGVKVRLKEEGSIRNIVATTAVRKPIDLERFLAEVHQEKRFQAIYEPEQFPAAILKIPMDQNVKATILLFSSGKMVIAGLTSLEQVHEAVRIIEPKLTPQIF